MITKLLMVSLLGVGISSSLRAMEKVASEEQVSIKLAGGEKCRLSGAEWKMIVDQSEILKKFSDFKEIDETGETGKVVHLPGLSKEGLAVLIKHLTLIQEGGKSLEDLFDSLMTHNQAQEYIALLMAGDYLAIESIVKAFYAVLDARIAQYLWQAILLNQQEWHDVFVFAPKKLAERIVLCASEKGNAEIVAHFLNEGCIDIDAQDQNGMTSLMHASRKGHTKIVELLLPYKPHGGFANHLGMTALMEASMAGRTDIVKLLLEHGAQGDIDKQSSFRCTALMYASSKGNGKIVALLLAHGAQCDVVEERGYRTALNFAVSRGHQEIVALLQAQGAQLGVPPDDSELALDW